MAEQQSVKLDKLPDEPMATGGMVPTKHEHNWMLQAAAAVVAAGLAKRNETWQHIYLKMAKAREMNVGALSANDLLYVVNGRVAIMGRMKLALVRRSGKYGYRFEETPDPSTEARFTIWPYGHEDEAYTAVWTYQRAVSSGCYKKGGVWDAYRDFMLRWRAVSEGVDVVAPDVCDLPTVEELSENFEYVRGGQEVVVHDDPGLVPRVVDAAVIADLPENPETGWRMDKAFAERTTRRMKRLGYSAEDVTQRLATCASDEEAQGLKDSLDEQERAQAPGPLFDGTEAPDATP